MTLQLGVGLFVIRGFSDLLCLWLSVLREPVLPVAWGSALPAALGPLGSVWVCTVEVLPHLPLPILCQTFLPLSLIVIWLLARGLCRLIAPARKCCSQDSSPLLS